MSTRGVAVIGNRYFFIRYSAHQAGKWFAAAFRQSPKSIDKFIQYVNMFRGAIVTEIPRYKMENFIINGDCEVIWNVDFSNKKFTTYNGDLFLFALADKSERKIKKKSIKKRYVL